MPATLVAAPAAAPPPEEHSLAQSLLYALVPALAAILCVLLLVPLMEAWHLPVFLGYLVGLTIGVVAVELGVLYYLGWRRNGRLSLAGIVLYRDRVPAGKLVLLSGGAFLWAGLVFTFAKGWLNSLLLPAFSWLPPLFQPMTIDWVETASLAVRITFFAVAMVGTAWVGPVVEELYFRGFLLPRMQRFGKWAPLVNTVLFSLYHFWSPWENLTRILAVAPMVYGVQQTKSIRVSLWTHCLVNTVSMAMLGVVLLQ